MILVALALAGAVQAGPPAPQGRAVIECRVTPAGWLRDCKVVSESPANANVGAFALKLAKGFHVQPGDRRIRDGRIRIPMQFKMPQPR
ncbi:MAG TPA: TonB family protein [Phenylobacterium sp.]|nr:TonB family protein [Phenylobacterium sp.]